MASGATTTTTTTAADDAEGRRAKIRLQFNNYMSPLSAHCGPQNENLGANLRI